MNKSVVIDDEVFVGVERPFAGGVQANFVAWVEFVEIASNGKGAGDTEIAAGRQCWFAW